MGIVFVATDGRPQRHAQLEVNEAAPVRGCSHERVRMTVWLCPGQGAQKPGMGVDLLKSQKVASVFDTLSDALEVDLAALSREGTQEQINDTVAAQGLTMAVSVGVGSLLLDRGIKPGAIVGFSLGQISALVLAGILSLDEAARLLKVRSESMAAACAAQPGGMLALMGASLDDAREVCAQAAGSDVLVCANHNGPSQVVVSGHDSALERAQKLWAEAGKKSVRLATSGAFHSPLMTSAATDVEKFCSSLDFKEPQVTLICNTDAKPFLVDEAAKRLGRHVNDEVMFEESIRALMADGETEFVEIGHGCVLTNLVKRIDRSTERHLVGTEAQVHEYITNNA